MRSGWVKFWQYVGDLYGVKNVSFRNMRTDTSHGMGVLSAFGVQWTDVMITVQQQV